MIPFLMSTFYYGIGLVFIGFLVLLFFGFRKTPLKLKSYKREQVIQRRMSGAITGIVIMVFGSLYFVSGLSLLVITGLGFQYVG